MEAVCVGAGEYGDSVVGGVGFGSGVDCGGASGDVDSSGGLSDVGESGIGWWVVRYVYEQKVLVGLAGGVWVGGNSRCGVFKL